MKEYILGFDVGGTKCAVLLGRAVDEEIDVLDRMQFPTEVESGAENALLRLEEHGREIVLRNGLELRGVRALGISCGGPLDSRRGVILSPPNLPGWDDIHITQRFEEAFGLPVGLQNDANACALAEWRWGAGRGCSNLIFLTFGTGIGAGLILNDRLYSGANDMAGEAGHVRLAEDGPFGYGKNGSFEGFCSGGGIARLTRQVVAEHLAKGESVGFCDSQDHIEQLTAQIVIEAARSGDRIAGDIVQRVARYLGFGLAILVDLLNPEIIVIGGIFSRARDMLWPTAAQVLAEESLPQSNSVCKVVSAALGEAIGDYACLSVARESSFARI